MPKTFGKEFKFNGKDVALKENIPTKLSQLKNDMGFTANATKITSSPIEPSQPQKGDVWI
ncbi:hypothetical protein HF846_15680 [Clostridium cadaveris]|uniref:hypothetical protein n=1 Tax=Clostridium cadaveris TaxID=1529 RepID=UPI001459B32F|nr:hypothetical protein [Clostridium cadaveris]NME66028.1 hypothetical protein [Clostridium cadaveris]NWK11311.1 hypothetical protein [Clostridium cadaveris]